MPSAQEARQRLDDPLPVPLGREKRTTTVIQFPETTQGFNRYTYVNNNPLSYTDPSGNWLQLFILAVKVIAGYMTAAEVLAAVVSVAWGMVMSKVVSGFIRNPYLAAFVSNFIGGGSFKEALFSTAVGSNKYTSAAYQVYSFFGQMTEPSKTRGTANGEEKGEVDRDTENAGGPGTTPEGITDRVDIRSEYGLTVEGNTLRGTIRVDCSKVSVTLCNNAIKAFRGINVRDGGSEIDLEIRRARAGEFASFKLLDISGDKENAGVWHNKPGFRRPTLSLKYHQQILYGYGNSS